MTCKCSIKMRLNLILRVIGLLQSTFPKGKSAASGSFKTCITEQSFDNLFINLVNVSFRISRRRYLIRWSLTGPFHNDDDDNVSGTSRLSRFVEGRGWRINSRGVTGARASWIPVVHFRCSYRVFLCLVHRVGEQCNVRCTVHSPPPP